jgi:hypothetical protein
LFGFECAGKTNGAATNNNNGKMLYFLAQVFCFSKGTRNKGN